jgi:hypothetical protein
VSLRMSTLSIRRIENRFACLRDGQLHRPDSRVDSAGQRARLGFDRRPVKRKSESIPPVSTRPTDLTRTADSAGLVQGSDSENDSDNYSDQWLAPPRLNCGPVRPGPGLRSNPSRALCPAESTRLSGRCIGPSRKQANRSAPGRPRPGERS